MRIIKSAAAGLVTIAAAGTLLAGTPTSAQASAVPERGHSSYSKSHTGAVVTSDRRRRRHRHRHWRRHHRYHRYHHRYWYRHGGHRW